MQHSTFTVRLVRRSIRTPGALVVVVFGAVGLNVVGVLMGVSAGFALGAFPPPVDIAILVVGVLCVRGGTELLRVVGDGSWLLGRSDDDQGGWGDDEPAPAPPDPILLRVTRISRAPVLR